MAAAPRALRRGQTLADAADHNHRVVLEALRRNGPLTRLDLAALTGLTAPGISNVLRRLIEAGLVAEQAGAGRSGAAQFAIAPAGAVGIGISVGGGNLLVEAIDLGGTLLHADEAQPDDLAVAIRRAEAAIGPTRHGQLRGIGIAAESDVVVPDMPGLTVFRERPTVAAALAERQVGPLREDASFVFVLLDHDVRAGLVIGGSIFDGVNGRAGRFGLIRTGEDGRALAEVASAAVIEAGARAATDPAWLDEPATHLMDAIVAVSGLLAPAEVVIGGALSDTLLDALVTRLAVERDRRTTSPIDPKWLPTLRRASVAGGGVARGAALLPFFDTLLPDPRRPG